MGLEFLELVLETEQRFGVSIPDSALSQVHTVGDYIDVVTGIVHSAEVTITDGPEPICRSSHAFYRLRRELLVALPLSRQSVRPSARLDRLVPRRDRLRIWKQLRRSGLRLPSLECGWRLGLTLLCLALAPAIVAWLWTGHDALLLLTLPSLLLVFRFARPLKIAVPATCAQIDDAARFLAWHPSVAGHLSRDTIAPEIRRIVAGITSKPVNEITDDLELVKDLNF